MSLGQFLECFHNYILLSSFILHAKARSDAEENTIMFGRNNIDLKRREKKNFAGLKKVLAFENSNERQFLHRNEKISFGLQRSS